MRDNVDHLGAMTGHNTPPACAPGPFQYPSYLVAVVQLFVFLFIDQISFNKLNAKPSRYCLPVHLFDETLAITRQRFNSVFLAVIPRHPAISGWRSRTTPALPSVFDDSIARGIQLAVIISVP